MFGNDINRFHVPICVDFVIFKLYFSLESRFSWFVICLRFIRAKSIDVSLLVCCDRLRWIKASIGWAINRIKRWKEYLRNIAVTTRAVIVILNNFCWLIRINNNTLLISIHGANQRLQIWMELFVKTTIVVRNVCISAGSLMSVNANPWHYCLTIICCEVSWSSTKFFEVIGNSAWLSWSVFHFNYYKYLK